jgi:hypothetical protein
MLPGTLLGRDAIAIAMRDALISPTRTPVETKDRPLDLDPCCGVDRPVALLAKGGWEASPLADPIPGTGVVYLPTLPGFTYLYPFCPKFVHWIGGWGLPIRDFQNENGGMTCDF